MVCCVLCMQQWAMHNATIQKTTFFELGVYILTATHSRMALPNIYDIIITLDSWHGGNDVIATVLYVYLTFCHCGSDVTIATILVLSRPPLHPWWNIPNPKTPINYYYYSIFDIMHMLICHCWIQSMTTSLMTTLVLHHVLLPFQQKWNHSHFIHFVNCNTPAVRWPSSFQKYLCTSVMTLSY